MELLAVQRLIANPATEQDSCLIIDGSQYLSSEKLACSLPRDLVLVNGWLFEILLYLDATEDLFILTMNSYVLGKTKFEK